MQYLNRIYCYCVLIRPWFVLVKTVTFATFSRMGVTREYYIAQRIVERSGEISFTLSDKIEPHF